MIKKQFLEHIEKNDGMDFMELEKVAEDMGLVFRGDDQVIEKDGEVFWCFLSYEAKEILEELIEEDKVRLRETNCHTEPDYRKWVPKKILPC